VQDELEGYEVPRPKQGASPGSRSRKGSADGVCPPFVYTCGERLTTLRGCCSL